MDHLYRIIHTSWNQDSKNISSIRETVFINEQQVPEELEWDEFDAVSHHVLALDNNKNPIGTGRITADGQIGRMSVLKNWRKKGAGKSLLNVLIE